MKRIAAAAIIAAAALLSGCANLILRTPLTSERIRTVYQPTAAQAGLTMAAAMPQTLFEPIPKYEFCFENIFTVPFAVIPAADLVVESALDTVFLPFDAYLAHTREKERR